MDEHTSSGRENVQKYKSKFMGKLFKEKKAAADTANDSEVNAFLHGPSDKLYMMPDANSPANPPHLSRIDTNSARRWPTAAEVTGIRDTGRRRSASPRRNRKGLWVRFTNENPEIIGEGGDEATSPVSEIGVRKRARSNPPERRPSRQVPPPAYAPNVPAASGGGDDFRPGPLRRAQTGYDSISEQQNIGRDDNRVPNIAMEDESMYNPGLKTEPEDPTSFAARVKAEMQAGEGRALLHASNTADIDYLRPESSEAHDQGLSPQLRELHLNTIRNSMISTSAGLPEQIVSVRPQTPPNDSSESATISDSPLSHTSTSQASQMSASMTDSLTQLSRSGTLQSAPKGMGDTAYANYQGSNVSSRKASNAESSFTLSRTPTMQSAALAVGDEALQDFSRRVAHLYTLFRLAAESVKPISTCSLEECIQAGLWWFLKGRMNLEASARDRPNSPQAHQANVFKRQQSYSDLGKSLWVMESISQKASDLSLGSGSSDPYAANLLEVQQSIMSGLRKLTMSMKRNGLLPQQDSSLPQGLDNTIWLHTEGNRSLVDSQRHNLSIPLSDAFPVGDTSRNFCFGRLFAECILEEEGASQSYRCQVLVSLIRGVKERGTKAIIASQDGALKMCIQDDQNLGPTWDNVTWQSKSNSLIVGLPRGFYLRLHCSEPDFRMIWGTYDYETKIHEYMIPRRGERLIFETVLKSFKYVDSSPDSRFPKESLPSCHLRVFEKIFVDKAATGVRTMHRGFRLALNTSPQTKTLRGIDQELSTKSPIQFNFLRGEDGQAALELRIDNSKSRYRIVLGFNEAGDRMRLHTLFSGTALGDGEDVVAEGLMKACLFAGHMPAPKEFNSFKMLDWQTFRIFNEFHSDLQDTKTVLSDHLRMVLDFKTGSLTDRINAEPGELKIRLDVRISKELKILRQPQEDMTMLVIESQVSRELPYELSELLRTVDKCPSTRTYLFPSLQDLHYFQSALTGFAVLYDGMATSFNISRRRMVVPIYKKWDAAATRLQIVQRGKEVQLVAFFEGFSHGDCMNFELRPTDIFEASGKSGKFSLRIVDAKFAMPKPRVEEVGSVDHEFVCLDMPEYPGEHDDITILFESEPERDRFAQALPAQTKVASRMTSVRR